MLEDHASAWTPAMARRIVASPETTVPLIDPDRVTRIMPGYHVWDFWPLMERDDPTRVARIDGWQVVIALTAPNTIAPEDRHDVATHRALVSPDGRDWRDGGAVFPHGAALGSRQWAGSAYYDAASRRMTTYYTAAGREGSLSPSYEQRLAVADALVTVRDDGPGFEDWSDHRIMLAADGALYRETRAGSAGPGMIDAFRDPQRFLDPRDGRQFLLFTASLAGSSSPYDGAVGIAEAEDETLTRWRLLPPLLHADGVNKELERAHIVTRDGRYYLFFISHPGTFAPEFSGLEGLYGFVADKLFGPWSPLNGSGLVLGNPPDAMYQSYSWFVLPNLRVLSFVDYLGIGGRSVADVTREPLEYQLSHFGGTAAPTLTLALDGDTTRLVDETDGLALDI